MPINFPSMHKHLAIIGCILLLAAGCKTGQKASGPDYSKFDIDTLPAINVSATPQLPAYNGSRTRVHDLLHTRLDVRFDWEKQHCLGVADLTLTPYFYPTNELVLDAKGFDIHAISMLPADSMPPLAYTYDSLQLTITLPKTYTRNDTFSLRIDYTAKPNELDAGGSAAITSDIGLYFINADGSDQLKPQQIWTQGETEASSCWFPTIDSPNERMTQELFITVKNEFTALSNGLLQFELDNGNGTHTFCWKQDKPHAPYLVMMAIGEFTIIEDQWRDLAVNYYMESDYAKHGKAIFGATPAMLEFFSTSLGVDYPWDKYHQIIVRDYVSGAMENTSAVIFGEFANQTPREMLDGDYEDVIAHELFHHWFGDLVTCESWANLPLNESFATYSEYLWREHAHGRDDADEHQQSELRAYMAEAQYKREDLVRFDYDDKEAMFDSHSYAKGSLVLHMLRKYVGDEAFWAGLKLYLDDNQYEAVEIHQLRLAYEEVTGEDLNWFFNQWFLDRSHPELLVHTEYNDSLHQCNVIVEQQQNFDLTPLYRLPVAIDFYHGKTVTRKLVVLDEVLNELTFPMAKPDLVNFDAENALLAEISYPKTPEEWIFQYHNAPLYFDRVSAVEACGANATNHEASAKLVLEAYSDPYWGVRSAAIDATNGALAHFPEDFKAALTDCALNDPEAPVRADAIASLVAHYEDAALEDLYRKALNDPSYSVMAEALSALAATNKTEALKFAKGLEDEEAQPLLLAVADLYGEYGTDAENRWFLKRKDDFTGFNQIAFIVAYENYLLNERSDAVLSHGIEYFGDAAVNHDSYYTRVMSLNALRNIDDVLGVKKHLLSVQLGDQEKSGASSSDLIITQTSLSKVSNLKTKVEEFISEAVK